MKWIGRLGGLGCCFALFVTSALADGPVRGGSGPGCCEPPRMILPPNCGTPQMPGQVSPGVSPDGTTPQTPGATAPNVTPTVPTDAFASATPRGTEPAQDDRYMMGDLIGIFGRRVILVPQGVTLPTRPNQPGQPGFQSLTGNITKVIAPLPLRTAFKITENESARPVDRVFFNYNYYNNVDRLLTGQNLSTSDLHREMIGFEKTFLDGNASVGLRVPFRQLTGNQGVEDRSLDDISIIFKYALINDRTTGNVLSTGMVLTLPTGDGLHIDGESTLSPTVFQPYFGYIYHLGDLYIQGFSAVAVPTDARDVTLLFNSVSVGYRLYRNSSPESWLTGVTPVAELHLNTPLNHRGLDQIPVGFSDSLNFTGGCYFQFRKATLGLGVGTPMTGPRPYDYEVTANLNYRF